VDDEIPF
jgi:hypothetical protein